MIKKVEIPRHTVPRYLTDALLTQWSEISPGHRFLLYFQGSAYNVQLKGEKGEVNRKAGDIEKTLNQSDWSELYKCYQPDDWASLKESKIYVLKSVGSKSEFAEEIATALCIRQKVLAGMLSDMVMSMVVKLTAPLTTGLGNPHPVENGFSFLSPYGIPYLPGSGIKGVLRRAAEELAVFDKESNWTIPLVWLLFGFERTSVYIAPPSKLESINVIEEEAERWRSAFRQYAEQKADTDEVLKNWLSIDAVRRSIPDEQRKLADRPSRFCIALQKDEKLRKSISWQGFIRFWDAFFSENSLEVDILNPHHKDYYEKGGSDPKSDPKATPNDAELPIPAFFLTIPPGTEFTLHCQFMHRGDEDMLLLSNWRNLIKEAVEYACCWLGFGAKTSVGYGAGETAIIMGDKKDKEEKKPQLGDEVKPEEKVEALPEYKRIVLDIENPSTSDNIVMNYFRRIDQFEGEEQRQIAQALKERWQGEGRWKVSKKRKQYQKVQKIKEILGEV